MLRQTMERLQGVHDYPAVSILLPTFRSMPDRQQNPVRVKNLVREAEGRLRSEFADHEVRPVVERLENLADHIDLQHPSDGLALFAAGSTGEVLYLPFPVEERVVVDETFATRDLVYALNRGGRYLVVGLSADNTRLFEGVRDRLEEVTDSGFPMSRTKARGLTSVEGGEGTMDSVYEDDADRQYFRRVDAALADIVSRERAPLVLIGAAQDVSRFREVTTNAPWIIASLPDHYGDEPDQNLAGSIWPMVEGNIEERKANAKERLGAAIGAGVFAAGLADIWTMAVDGRVALLAVEDDYHQPGRPDESGRTLALTDDREAPGVLDDAVGELVDIVVRNNGEIVFMDRDELMEHNRAAAVLRY